ncbi:MAG: hypothetical protein M1829_001002 [Trizodia sp. TS-e1964]|nr:MAG: hypothetical protein M1829_001002 [Trizodia sp. TS-e1964]
MVDLCQSTYSMSILLDASRICLLLLLLSPGYFAESIWDYAPDFANDTIQPYPSLNNPDGSAISLSNLRGTRLFGFKGCQTPEANAISEAYNDFYTLSQQSSLYKNLDWTSQAANDFWGPSSG